MANTKILNIEISECNDQKENKEHFDKVNQEFAEDHYGSYVLYKVQKDSRQIHSRIYLSYILGKIFREVLLSSRETANRSTGFLNYKKSTYCILDDYPTFSSFIKDTAVKIIPENLSRIGVTNYIGGMGVFLKTMTISNYRLEKFSEITMEHQNVAWNIVSESKYSQTEKNKLYTFFNAVSNFSEDFIVQRKNFTNNHINIIGLPSTTLFEIDYYARIDMDIYKSLFLETKSWLIEFKKNDNLFCLANLACTFYKGYELNKSNQRSIIADLSLSIHGIKLNSWKKRIRSNGKTRYTYENDFQKKEHMRLLEIAKNGLDIMINTDKICFFWMLETIPNFLEPTQIDVKYKNYLSWEYLYHHGREKGINTKALRKRIYPSIQMIYPFYLFLLIREGINVETLNSWKVKREDNRLYTLGEDLGLVRIVQGVKNRSKDIQWTPIKRNSTSEYYINFYLEWLTIVYDDSGLNNLFQYCVPGGQNTIDFIRDNVLKKARSAKDWFFKKYEIYMSDGIRVNYIDHRQPRVNMQFNDYLKGLNEWERQRKRSHNSIDTQLHYDNMNERKVVQRYKLGKVLDLAEGIFRGIITSDKNEKVKVFNGLFSDCSDPKNPTHKHSLKIAKNEVCTDWFMCLGSCNNSVVDFKIHGPAIMAYFHYMNAQINQLSNEIWEKEYSIHYDVAKEIIEQKMTEEERKYCKKHENKYFNLVRMQFKRKHFVQDDLNVG